MAYIIKKNEPLVNLKLTNKGRQNLSQGKLTLTYFGLGDGETDYSSDDFSKVNILRPADNQHEIQYPVPSEGENFFMPISTITSVPIDVFKTADLRGFFSYDNNNIEVDTALCTLSAVYTEVSGGTGNTTNEVVFDMGINVTGSTFYNNFKTTLDKGDLVFAKIKSAEYSNNYTELFSTEITPNPIPYLMYEVVSINGGDSFNLAEAATGATGTTLMITLDRQLPQFDGQTLELFFYPTRNPILNYYDNPTPVAYWSGGLLDFTTNNTQVEDDVPVWNLAIATIEDFIGLDSLVNKGKYTAYSRNFWGSVINYDYFIENEINKLGIIHYTNNTVSNFYGEGFYENTFKLMLPYLMWHKKQFGGAGLANEIGYTFICGTELKTLGNNVKYYDLIDQEIIPTVVGKVLPNQKIALIEHPELLAALSYKANRNWTLPKPVLTLTQPGACAGSSIVGSLNLDETLHISYLFTDIYGISGIQCEDYASIDNLSDSPKDVVFEFPKSNSDPTYNEFGYLKDYTGIDGYGFKVSNILLLWQKTPVTSKPTPSQWNYFNINRYVGTNGCISTIGDLCDNFELYSESVIFNPNTMTNDFTLIKDEIGDVIVSVNGVILNSASSRNAVGIDGDFYKTRNTPQKSTILITNAILTTGTLIQFHYLVGTTTTTSTVRQDFDMGTNIPPTSYVDNETIYMNDGKVTLPLSFQPNNSVVFLFYNGQLISSNNYGVFTIGTPTERRVELEFTPAQNTKISVFYLDNSGLGGDPVNTLFTAISLNNLRVNIDKGILDISENSTYDISSIVTLPPANNVEDLSFGDETFLHGNISVDIKATIYKSLITCNVFPNKFIKSANPTFNVNQDKVSFSEMGIYDEDNDLVAIGKFSEPLKRKYNSDMLIIQATIDF